MSSLEHTQKSGQGKEPMDYELEYQKLKEENALLKQSLEREQKLNAELKAHNSPLLVTGMCSDVTLLVEGKKMAVHQNVLSAHSPVLADALLKRQSEDGVLVITGTKADTFEMLLRFLYTGKVPLLERQSATELMAAAKEYQLEGLKKCLIGQLVSHLPDLVLKALFRQMTLEDQIKARKVCRRWADLVLEATSKRRQLTLLLGNDSIVKFKDQIDCAFVYEGQALKLLLNADGLKMYPTRRLTSWNSLHLDSLDEASAEEIASTFTETKELQVTVRQDSFSTVDNLAHLFELWSGQLIDLQFFEDLEYLFIHSELFTPTRLFTAINAQSALKHLHLNLDTLKVPDLSIVSQLEELRFYSHHTTTEHFAQWLQQYGEGNQGLARIEYVADEDASNVLDLFSRLSEPLRHCFILLDATPISDPARICAHFRGLTSLTICPSRITPRHFFTHLANLRQLIHLSLPIDSVAFSSDDLEYHHLLLPQVKSVKALELVLDDSIPVHQELAQLKLAWTLPNVEVIYFELYFKCTECHIDNFRKPSEQAKSCLRQLFAPLKRDCTKLRLIKHDVESLYGTAEELLAEPTSEH